MTTSSAPFPAWNDQTAAGLDEPGLLLYRSNLLGSDLDALVGNLPHHVAALPAQGCAFWAAATDPPTCCAPESTAAGKI